MIEACPAPERLIRLPLGPALAEARSMVLMKTAGLELIRLVVPAGAEIPPHRVPGECTIQCVEGRVSLSHDGSVVELGGGDMLHLCPQESHSLRAVEPSCVLVTRLRPHADEVPETFPAP